ncbi:MAG: sensory box histidine kinase/response regulator [Myxococcaceae bacterium]|jgi:CheY-like chemotaxis protein|nr:sensory box histidine kinase/response regulator [Myxococcaceae bacterium]MEA2750229.1 two-component system, cell cycle sensor histidine kinase and response regulator CckA [Myxococcales bacterium]
MVLPRLLVIDDDAQIRRVFTRTLGRHFYVDSVGDGEEAFAMIDHGAVFDAILCDLHLPGTSGHAIYEELLHRSRAMAARFVIITGGVPDADDAFATMLGERYVMKTCGIIELARLLCAVAFPLISSPPVAPFAAA